MRFRWVMIVCLMIIFQAGAAHADIYLRVIGNSDSAADIRIKEEIRDVVLHNLPSTPAVLSAAAEGIAQKANAVAPCTLALVMHAPIKKAPARPTLLVRVGAGRGHNWFGLIYEESLSFFSMDACGFPRFHLPIFNWLFPPQNHP